jgi:hypothetical protein
MSHDLRRHPSASFAEPAARSPEAPGRATLTARLAPSPASVAAHLYRLMRKADRDDLGVAADAREAVGRAAASSGEPLPDAVRARFEGSLGADLSSVRVHTGADSAAAADAVGARAYALGSDIHFGAGEYAPVDPFGLHLLAHEVAHTVQQAGGAATGAQCKLEVSTPGDAHEIEADRAADAMVEGARFAVGGGAVGMQREPAPVAPPAPATAAPDPADTALIRWSVDWKGLNAGRASASLPYVPSRTHGDVATGTLKVTPHDGKAEPKTLPWTNGANMGAVPVGIAPLPKGKGGEVASDIKYGRLPAKAARITIALDDQFDPASAGTMDGELKKASAAVEAALQRILDVDGNPQEIDLLLEREARLAIGALNTVDVHLETPTPIAGTQGAEAASTYAPVTGDGARKILIEVESTVQTAQNPQTQTSSSSRTTATGATARRVVSDLDEQETITYTDVMATIDRAISSAFSGSLTSFYRSHTGGGFQFGGELHGEAGAKAGGKAGLDADIDIDQFEVPIPRPVPMTLKGKGKLKASGAADLSLDGLIGGEASAGAGYTDDTLKGYLTSLRADFASASRTSIQTRVANLIRNKRATTTFTDVQAGRAESGTQGRGGTSTSTVVSVAAVPRTATLIVTEG